MTPRDMFVRTFLKASAILLGLMLASIAATTPWSTARKVTVAVTAQKLAFAAQIESLGASDPAVRAKAACELRKQGEDAAPALGALVALLEDAAPVDADVCRRHWGRQAAGDRPVTTPGQEAAGALVSIGQRAVPALLGALDSASWVARRNAAWALGALDEPRAVAPILRLLQDPQPAVREQAAWALGVLDDESAAPAIIRALKDDDARVRRQAAWSAGVIEARGAVDPLLLALKDPDAGVRRQAAWALGIIGR
jgi:HEAT repeat protein